MNPTGITITYVLMRLHVYTPMHIMNRSYTKNELN